MTTEQNIGSGSTPGEYAPTWSRSVGPYRANREGCSAPGGNRGPDWRPPRPNVRATRDRAGPVVQRRRQRGDGLTNLVIERKDAVTVVIIRAGSRDILKIGREIG